MVKNKEFTEEERLTIYRLRVDQKKTLKTIAKKFMTCKSAISKVVKHIETYGMAHNLQGRGRKRCTSKRTDRLITNMVLKDRNITAEQVRESLPTDEKNISNKTIGNRLKENRLFSGFATKKPLISKKNKKLRLEFAKNYISKPPEFWRHVIWSDESKFEIINSKRKIRVYKRRGEGLNPQTIQSTVKHPKSVMVWGCVSASGTGNLVEVATTMTGQTYVDIMENNLFASAEAMGLKNDFIYQQDNDPKHTSRVAKKWFADNDVNVLQWPPQSPDLSYIENLWDFIDRNIPINKRNSMKTFKDAIFETWKNVPQKIIDKLVESIPKRLAEVIKQKGGPTKY